MKVLDLFSGIGGFSLGLERAGMETVAFCEIEEYPRQVLRKHWPDVPIFDDIRTLTRGKLDEAGITDIDILCGGYPCQPFSTAGKRKGSGDDRHLWPEYLRLIREIRPRWIIGENVAGHISMGLDAVLSDLESEGYTWEPFVIPACAVDAKHRRDRIWIIANIDSDGFNSGNERESGGEWASFGSTVAFGEQRRPGNQKSDSDSRRIESSGVIEQCGKKGFVANASGRRFGSAEEREDQQPRGTETICGSETLADPTRSNDRSSHAGEGKRQEQQSGNRRCQENVADSDSGGFQGGWPESEHIHAGSSSEAGTRWPTEPNVGRVANGVPNRVDRIKGLGNAVVPQIPEIIGRAIMEIESNIN